MAKISANRIDNKTSNVGKDRMTDVTMKSRNDLLGSDSSKMSLKNDVNISDIQSEISVNKSRVNENIDFKPKSISQTSNELGNDKEKEQMISNERKKIFRNGH